MRAFIRASAWAVVCLGMAVPLAAARPDDKPKVKIEFRRAETKPADGLTEATVPGSKDKIYLHKTPDLTSADVVTVSAGKDRADGLCIDIVLSDAGAKKMEALSEKHLEKPLAIVIDGKVWSAPVIKGKITDKVQITGKFTKDEVDKLVNAFNEK
jgi:preprotein translocase subunit SecD